MNKEKMYKIISILKKFNGFLIFTKEKDQNFINFL